MNGPLTALPAAPSADSQAQVLSQWNAVYDAYNEVACLILGTKDDTCHHCKEVGHWKRNCHVYLAELLKKKKKVGSASSSGKMTRKLFPHHPERATDLLGIIHTDVCGPLRHVSRQGAAYFIPSQIL
ncbi:retrotransposon protein, putative, ty1-copia subclass [Tanacetum coccineum]